MTDLTQKELLTYYEEIYDKEINIDDLKSMKKGLPSKKIKKKLVYDFVKNNKSTGTVLSIGCGLGEYLSLFENDLNNYMLYGTDISANALKLAERYFKGANYFQSNGENLSFQTDKADVVLAIDVIEHTINDEAVLDEISRVIKKDGVLVAVVPCIDKREGFTFDNSFQDNKVLGEGGDLRVYGRDFLDKLKERGFTITKVKFIEGSFAKFFRNQKNKIFSKRDLRPKVIKGDVSDKQGYSFLKKVLGTIYHIDYLLYGNRKGEYMFIGAVKNK